MREPLCEQRDFIIEAALVYVPFYGWSWKALEKAGVDLADDAILVESGNSPKCASVAARGHENLSR